MRGFVDFKENSLHAVQYRSLVRNLSNVSSVRLIKKRAAEGDFRKTLLPMSNSREE
jgi:hypothetical protein